MKSRNIHQVFILLTALLIVILGSGAAFAQGKGHDKGGGGGEKHGGGAPQIQKQEKQEKHQEQRQQQRYERPQIQREAQRVPSGWQKQEQKQEKHQQAWRVEQQRQPEVRQIPYNGGFQQMPKINDKAIKQQAKQQAKQERAWQKQVPGSNAWPNNYGYQRSNEVQAQKAERKAWKEAWKQEEKALRSSAGNNRLYVYQYQVQPVYRDNSYVYQYPQHARASALRTLIASVLGSNTGYNDYYYSQAQPVYYGNPYYTANYGTANYGGNYYNGYPQYQSYAAAPYYANYQPYGYSYDTQYNGDPYYADNYYYDQQPSYYTSSNSGGGFMQQLFSKLLALGYGQGYNEGLNARRAGYGDRYYSDPYAYGDTNYVSYSNTLGENRRCMSDGYELGYNDALYNQRGSDSYQNIDPYQNNGNVDLVSLLIGSVLQGS